MDYITTLSNTLTILTLSLSLSLLYRLFKTYDFDSDGKISLYDLKMTLEIQNGRDYNVSNQNGDDYVLLCTWISQRDTTGTGFVNYDDFVKYYAQLQASE